MCGEHAWACPRGKQREQAPALHTLSPGRAASVVTQTLKPLVSTPSESEASSVECGGFAAAVCRPGLLALSEVEGPGCAPRTGPEHRGPLVLPYRREFDPSAALR